MEVSQEFEKDEEPLLSKRRINFRPKYDIVAMCVESNTVIIGLKSNVVLRINLNFPDQHDELDIIKGLPHNSLQFADTSKCLIYNIFQDPTSVYAIIALSTGDNLFLNKNSKKLKVLPKLKGHLIEFVGWNKFVTAVKKESGPILIGTDKGCIIETNLQQVEDKQLFHSNVEVYSKLVLNLSKDAQTKITGIEFDKIPTKISTELSKYFVIITTTDRLYQYIHTLPNINFHLSSIAQATQSNIINTHLNATNSYDTPFLAKIFAKYEAQPEKFHELPGRLANSRIVFNYRAHDYFPLQLAWLSGSGIYLGKIDCTFRKKEDSVITDTHLIPYSTILQDINTDSLTNKISPPDAFLGAVLTRFHLLLVYTDRLVAINILSQKVVMQDEIPKEFGSCVGITQDLSATVSPVENNGDQENNFAPVQNNIWVFCQRAVFRYRITHEDRDVWRIYLDRGNFESAKQYCQNDPVNLDQVLQAQAEYTFSRESDFIKAAQLYAASRAPIQEVALRFYIEARKLSTLCDAPGAKLTATRQTNIINSNTNNNNNNNNNYSNNNNNSYVDRVMKGCTLYLQTILETRIKITEKPHMTLLVLWICEIYLTRLNKSHRHHYNNNIDKDSHYINFNKHNKTYAKILEDFKEFLQMPQIKECLFTNQNTIFKLISNHDNEDAYLYFAQLNQDYEKMLEYYMERNAYETVLQILVKQRDPELYYKFSSRLISAIPTQLIQSWHDSYLKHKVWLDPSRLLPAMVKLLTPPTNEINFNSSNNLNDNNENTTSQIELINKYALLIIKYLEFCVNIQSNPNNNNRDQFNFRPKINRNNDNNPHANISTNPFDMDLDNEANALKTQNSTMTEIGTEYTQNTTFSTSQTTQTDEMSYDSLPSPNITPKIKYQNISSDMRKCSISARNNTGLMFDVPTTIHNFLMSLYCQYQPDQLLVYLRDQGTDVETIRYDMNYALRLSTDYNNVRANVYLLTVMNLYEEAVNLALNFDVQLAKQTANLLPVKRNTSFGLPLTNSNEEQIQTSWQLKKRLWIIIAQNLISDCDGSDDSLKLICHTLLKESENVLQIEDILPFFPDFSTIDHFKDAIMLSVHEYTATLKTLQEEMDECMKSADTLRLECEIYRNSSLTLKPGDRCSFCRKYLWPSANNLNFSNRTNDNNQNYNLTSPYFHLFACHHFFHTNCLIKEMKRLSPKHVKDALLSAEKLIKKASYKNESNNNEFENLIGTECPYCGTSIINSVDMPFIERDIFDQEYKSWL